MCILGKAGWRLLNERGISWAETMLSLSILFLVFGSLLPLMHRMHSTLEHKQERLEAYKTLYEGAREWRAGNTLEGSRKVDGINYFWIKGEHLCVSYKDFQGNEEQICAED